MSQIFYDRLLSTAKLIEANSEHPVETEILLADYDEPVFKIVKTTMEHLITQKYIMQNKLTVEGFIKLSIYYQPPGNAPLALVSQKLPFQKQVELPNVNCDLNFINISGQSQYINTRPQNSTRIDVRGAYLFNIKVFVCQSTNVITAIKGGICCDSTDIPHFCLTGQSVRRFSMENELNLPETTDKIIRVHTNCANPDIAVYQDKITAKGEIEAIVFYTEPHGKNIKSHTQVFPYNQIIDMQGIQENHISSVDVSVSSFGITQNSDSKKYIASVTVQLDATAFAKQQVTVVKDAFSRGFEYDKTEQQQLCDINMYTIDKSLQVTLQDGLPADYSVCDIIVELSPPKSYFEINKTTVKAKIAAHIIAVNGQGEYECFTKAEDMALEWLEGCGQYDEICIRLSPKSCSYSHTGDNLQINVTVSATGIVIEKQPVQLLKSFDENTEKPSERLEEALIVYYASKGERVFDIAKNHKADPIDIIEENSLQGDILQSEQMLFIPAYVQ